MDDESNQSRAHASDTRNGHAPHSQPHGHAGGHRGHKHTPHRPQPGRAPSRKEHDDRDQRQDDKRDQDDQREGDDSKEQDDEGKDEQDDEKDDEKEKPQTPEERERARKKKIIILISIAAVVVIGLIIGIPWYLHARHFENTDDAFIDAHTEHVAPRVAGRVLKVLVDDNQFVHAKDPLLVIEPADFNVRVREASGSLAEAQGRLAQAGAQEKVAEANVAQMQADLEQAQVTRENADRELSRYEKLSTEAVSRQRLDDLRATARNAAAHETAAAKKLAATQAQVELAKSQTKSAQASVQSAQAQVDQAKLDVSYTTVSAAVDGRVAQRNVQSGDWIAVGQQLMMIVPNEKWVTANFKETQLTDMRIGQPVSIYVDAYPDVEFDGKVDSFQSGTGAAFSLLPAENATGNYVKVVQRVPVKIIFDDTSSEAFRQLSPGMSVEPKVRVR